MDTQVLGKTSTETNTGRSQASGEPVAKVYKTKKFIFRSYQIIWYLLGIIEVLLVFRVLLKFIGAAPQSAFTNLIYQLSEPFAAPFIGIVAPAVTGNSVLEWSTFIAMAVYAILAWGLVQLFQLIRPVDRTEIEQTVNTSY